MQLCVKAGISETHDGIHDGAEQDGAQVFGGHGVDQLGMAKDLKGVDTADADVVAIRQQTVTDFFSCLATGKGK